MAGEPHAPVDMATLRVVFVDDEPANVRMGLRMLARMGVLASNVVQLRDGELLKGFIVAAVAVVVAVVAAAVVVVVAAAAFVAAVVA
jgi:hypothetical protein